MEFSVQSSMLTNRTVSMHMRASNFGDEQFLTVLSLAMRSHKYRIQIDYMVGKSTEVQTLVIGSSDEDGYPHIDPEGEPA